MDLIACCGEKRASRIAVSLRKLKWFSPLEQQADNAKFSLVYVIALMFKEAFWLQGSSADIRKALPLKGFLLFSVFHSLLVQQHVKPESLGMQLDGEL